MRVVVNLSGESLLSRAALLGGGESANKLGAECGYEFGEPGPEVYRGLIGRNGAAARVNGVYPDECWSTPPSVTDSAGSEESPFEAAFDALDDRYGVFEALHRADVLSGYWTHGAVLIGFDDVTRTAAHPGGRGLDSPVLPGRRNLLFLRPLDGWQAAVLTLDADENSPRYGQPETYSVTFSDPRSLQAVAGAPVPVTDQSRTPVHWTRVLHLADNLAGSETYGVPRLRPVLDYLYDLRKVGGGSAEMFWKGAFPGYSFETTSPDVELDAASLAAQAEAFQSGLRRFFATENVHVNSLAPQVADPTAHAQLQLTLICGTIGVPMPVFLGREEGHMASMENKAMWNRRLGRRCNLYLTRRVVRPFVDRMVEYGVLPAPQGGRYKVDWADLNTLSDTEKADVALKYTQAFMQYVTGHVSTLVPPAEFFTHVCGYPPAVVKVLVAAVAAYKVSDPAAFAMLAAALGPKPVAAGGNPTSGKRSPGRTPGTVSKS